MSAQHTPGRMTVHTDGADGWPLLMIGGPAGRIVANVNTESGVDTTKAPSIAFKPMPATENARRLAACWNACEGVPTDLLEANPAPFSQLRAQRDELLEALKAAHHELHYCSQQLVASGWTEGSTVRSALDGARAAIAKATGGEA